MLQYNVGISYNPIVMLLYLYLFQIKIYHIVSTYQYLSSNDCYVCLYDSFFLVNLCIQCNLSGKQQSILLCSGNVQFVFSMQLNQET